MRLKLYLLTALCVVWMGCAPKQSKVTTERLKARFEVEALCSNYTFSLIEGKIDPSLVETGWIDPQTKKTYKNAFGILNPCDLPAGLKQGDEFYFEITNTQNKNCMVCMAYYPTPQKKLNIKVIQ